MFCRQRNLLLGEYVLYFNPSYTDSNSCDASWHHRMVYAAENLLSRRMVTPKCGMAFLTLGCLLDENRVF